MQKKNHQDLVNTILGRGGRVEEKGQRVEIPLKSKSARNSRNCEAQNEMWLRKRKEKGEKKNLMVKRFRHTSKLESRRKDLILEREINC